MADSISKIKNLCDVRGYTMQWSYQRVGGADHNPLHKGSMSILNADQEIITMEQSYVGSTKQLKVEIANNLLPKFQEILNIECDKGSVIVQQFNLTVAFSVVLDDGKYYLRSAETSTQPISVELRSLASAQGFASKLLSNSAMRTQLDLTKAHVMICDRYFEHNMVDSVVVSVAVNDPDREAILKTSVQVDVKSGINFRKFKGRIYILSNSQLHANFGYVLDMFKTQFPDRVCNSSVDITVSRAKLDVVRG